VKPQKQIDPLAGCVAIGTTACGRLLYRRGEELFTYWAWGDEILPATAEQIATTLPLVDMDSGADERSQKSKNPG